MGYFDQGEFYNFDGDFNEYVKKEGEKNRPTFNLKDGYESRFLGNGDNQSTMGALATYTNDYDDLWDSYEPDRDKSTYGIFATKPSGRGGGGGGKRNRPSKRSTGGYDDIIGGLKVDQASGLAQADQLKAQQAQAMQSQTAALTASFDKQIADINAANAANMNALTSKYDQQASQFADYQTLMSSQLATAEANYQQQAQMVKNMESAYVPEANPNAFAAAIGDQRVDDNRPRKSNRLSDLSSLSIVSGLGTASNPLSGLQLA